MSRLVYKVHGTGLYGTYKFPLKLRPEEDELLSSWLSRLALKHRTAPMTFTNLYMPETKNRFWNVDLDLQGNPETLAAISEKSGVPVDVLHSMTLKSYEGYLVEKIYGKNGATQFVGPLSLRGRRSTFPGLRYCPLCLGEDEHPYFRKKWRLSFSVVCLKHRCYLEDRCQKCGATLTPYLAGRAGRIDACHKCDQLLHKAKMAVPGNDEVYATVERIYRILEDGYVMIASAPVYSHLYFTVLHQILRLMISGRYGNKLRDGAGLSQFALAEYNTIESVPLHVLADLVVKAAWLLESWPQRFIDICKRQRLLSSALLRDFEQAPYWYWKIVVESLYRPDTIVTVREIQEAVRFILKRGWFLTEASISKMLGVSQVFRKRQI